MYFHHKHNCLKYRQNIDNFIIADIGRYINNIYITRVSIYTSCDVGILGKNARKYLFSANDFIKVYIK